MRSTRILRILDDIGRVAVIGAVALCVAFLVVPILMTVVMSVDSRNFLGRFPPTGLSFKWFQTFFTDAYYLGGLKTSLILAASTTVICTSIGVCTALALYRADFKGRDAIAALFLSPLVVPGVVIGFAMLLYMSYLGVTDGFVRLLAAHVLVALPYTIRATLAGLTGIKPSYVEAALSLGASERRAFWDVTFPLAKTGIATGAVFAFAFSMDDVAVSMFLTDPKNYTLPIALVSMMRSQFDLTIAAAAVVMIASSAVLMLVLDRIVGLDRVIGQGVFRS